MAFDTDPPEAAEFKSPEDILDIDDIREDVIYVPEWQTKLRIRGLTLEQIAQVAVRATRRDPRTGQDVFDRKAGMAFTFIYGVIEPKFAPASIGKLYQKNAGVVSRIVNAINALGPTEEGVVEAEKSPDNGHTSTVPIPISIGPWNDSGDPVEDNDGT